MQSLKAGYRSTTEPWSRLTPSFIAACLILLLVLWARITRGLDLTDEMQYYGQIAGLIETGRLFSNDLFIQQSVYILFYPFFGLYHFFFGFDGLVFFGRLLMALLSMAVFLYAYRYFLALDFSALIASLSALSLTFAIPYHGIFAPSYNTISQVLWIVFTLKFFEWKRSGILSLGAIPIVMVFAHPTSSVTMSLLIAVRLLAAREFSQATRLAVFVLGGAMLAAAMFLYFATPQDYLASLKFSSGYGVGAVFFSSKSQPITLLGIFAIFLAALIFQNPLRSVPFALPVSLSLAGAVLLFSAGLAGGAYTPRIIYALSLLSVLAYAWSLSNVSEDNRESRSRLHWLAASLLVYATTLGVTSGNGIGQATGAFMVGLPFLLGIAVSPKSGTNAQSSRSLTNVACAAFVVLLFIAHWSRYPYREVSWLRASAPIQSVPEFRFISSSLGRAAFLQRMQHELKSVTQGRRTLLVSEYPGLYFALGARPETCMLYMHSLTSDKSEQALLNCLGRKQPEVIVDLFAQGDIASDNSRIKRVLHDYYLQPGVSCAVRQIQLRSPTNGNPEQLKYFACTKSLARFGGRQSDTHSV